MAGFEGQWHEIVGVIGAAIVLGAYFGLQSGRLAGDGVAFQVANILGAYKFNLGAMVIEVSWIAISLYGLVRGLSRRGAAKAADAPQNR
jgi:paired small multidrug resistance pump